MLVHPDAWQPQGIEGLEPRAWEALRITERSVCVTAGAGAGKTEFLAQKAAYLLQTGICSHPKRILAISFKRDAARNLEERVSKRCLPDQARRFDSLTFDGFTKQLIDRFRKALPPEFCPPPNYHISVPTQTELRSFLQNHGFHGVNPRDLENGVTKFKLPLDSATNGAAPSQAVVEYWRSQYRDHDEGLLTFPMINRLAEWLLREDQSIRCALQITYPFVFIDEFQDTTFAQYELLQSAFLNSHTAITAVGDDKQRIMGWAGAMPDAFSRFKADLGAHPVSLLSNWRSHDALVRIQHAIAHKIDPHVEVPHAKAERGVAGDVAAIWEFINNADEATYLARWISEEIKSSDIQAHDIGVLVRLRANDVENELKPVFLLQGLKLRNVARNVGDISIQDLLGEHLTQIFIPLLRLGASTRSPSDWIFSQQSLNFLQGLDLSDEPGQQRLMTRLQDFVRELRIAMNQSSLNPEAAQNIAERVMSFVGASALRQAFPAYQREADFNRVWDGYIRLLRECVESAGSWQEALDKFEGRGQIALMTIHRSKGLEFHTMIFYGLDNQTWWSLRPNATEELSSFFVAFTRAKQRAFFTLCSERGQPVTWIEELLAPVGVHRIDGTSIVIE